MSVSKVVVLVFLMFKCCVGIDSTQALLDRINTLERLMSDKLSFVQNELYSTQRDLASLKLKFETAEKSQMILMNGLFKCKEEVKECKEQLSEHADELSRSKQELQFIKTRLAESNKLRHYSGEVHDGENDFSNESRTVNVNDINRPGKPGNSILKRTFTSGTQGVAFYARTEQHEEHMRIRQTVVFDNVVTNDGGYYNSDTGIFRAPKTGTYAFSVTIMSYVAEDVTVEMVKNEQNVGSTYCGNGNTHGVGSLTMVLHMLEGDIFLVRIKDNSRNAGNVKVYGGGYSSLSGFFMY